MNDSKDIRRIACVTMESLPGDIPGNAEKIKHYMTLTAQMGARLAVFPELSLTGYVADACDLAIPGDAPVLQDLARQAGELGIAASVGFFEKAGDKKYVAQGFLHEGKIKSVYRKIYCCEKGGNDGQAFETVDWDGATIATIICKDLHFPAVTRQHVMRGAAVILQPSAYRGDVAEPFDNENHNVYLPRARARENGVFFFHVNASGCPKDNQYCLGNAIAVAPNGRVLGRIDNSPYSENTMVVDIDLAEVLNSPAHENIEEDLKRRGLLPSIPPGK